MAEKKKSLKVRKFKNKRLLGAGSRLNRKAYGDVLMLILVGVMAVFSFFPLLMSIGMALKPVNYFTSLQSCFRKSLHWIISGCCSA